MLGCSAWVSASLPMTRNAQWGSRGRSRSCNRRMTAHCSAKRIRRLRTTAQDWLPGPYKSATRAATLTPAERTTEPPEPSQATETLQQPTSIRRESRTGERAFPLTTTFQMGGQETHALKPSGLDMVPQAKQFNAIHQQKRSIYPRQSIPASSISCQRARLTDALPGVRGCVARAVPRTCQALGGRGLE